MKITINGREQEVTEQPTVSDVLRTLALAPEFLAVAVNGDVVRRAELASTRLSEGDRVELLSPSQGG